MKKRVLHYLAIGALAFTVACGSDDSEPEPDGPIVGTWELDLLAYNDFPTGYTNNNGAVIFPYEIGIEEWTFTFNNDDTYESRIEQPGPNSITTGTYVYEGDDLELTPDDFDSGDITDFTVEELEENNSLTLSIDVNVTALPDAVTDTLTQNPTEEMYDSLAVLVQARLYYFFEK
ncbi:MAG: lipocalin family protein [Cyclobacteriaceae bacterium]